MDNQSEPVGEAWKLNPEYHKVSDFLGVNIYDRNDAELAKKVFALKDWAMAGKENINDALFQMQKMKRELGHNFIGKPLVVEMYKTMRLNQMRNVQVRKELPQTVTKPETKEVKKDTSLEGVIKQAVQSTISNAVKEAISDKDFLSKSIKENIK